MKHILIIGAGILGAAIAYRCAKAGARVTVVDRIGPAAGASGTSFGWVNASFYADADHFALRVTGIDAWHRLHKELEALAITWGTAIWFEEQGAGLARKADALLALGYPCTRLDRQAILDRVAGLAAPDSALEFAAEGAVDCGRAVRQLLDAAADLGARLISGVEVTALLRGDAGVTGVTTDAGQLTADQVVVAAGVGAERLLGLPMLRRPGLLMKTQPVPLVLAEVLVTPEGEIRQDAKGRLVMPTAVAHQADTRDALTANIDVLAEAALRRLGALFPGLALAWSDVSLGMRPVPQDGLPVIGAMGPGLYAAVMHSGVTLAAITGEYVAQEVLDGTLINRLGPYRPDRFQGHITP